MQYKCSFEIHNKCENSALCHLCDGSSLYRNSKEEARRKEEERRLRKEAEKNEAIHVKKEKKMGMNFEQTVVKKWNNHFSKPKTKQHKKPRIMVEETAEDIPALFPTAPSTASIPKAPLLAKKTASYEAKRQVNSGALWHSKGDIKLDHALLECKERGTVNSKGEKTISIPKEWLDKQAIEAVKERRNYWYVPFRYKGSEDIYIVKPFDHELELIQRIRDLEEQVQALTKE
jgi:hypothetical protein